MRDNDARWISIASNSKISQRGLDVHFTELASIKWLIHTTDHHAAFSNHIKEGKEERSPPDVVVGPPPNSIHNIFTFLMLHKYNPH